MHAADARHGHANGHQHEHEHEHGHGHGHEHDHANGPDHEHAPAPSAPPGVGIARHDAFDAPAFERAVADLLRACGLAADTAHMDRTPQRVRELWQRRLLGGYDLDPAAALGEGFADDRHDLVVIRGIAVHGVCPHHLVPFRGVAHVGYLPGGRLHGFGRIARMVDAIGHRFTYQEWMTRDVAEALVVHGRARGAACVIEAEQLCLLLGEDRRGDERVVTQAFAGSFEHSDRDRAEFLRAIAPHGR
ncbi:MAG: GTP cyclohydrolase I FolE [Burkholderiales bacterium]|nr:MAG: GTP cyclohydrolase I FolE [Burkholderiales bacterium]